MHFKKQIRNATMCTNLHRRRLCAVTVGLWIEGMGKVNPILAKLTNIKLASGMGYRPQQ